MCVFVRRIRSYSERHVSCHWNLLYNQTCHIVGFLFNVFLVFFLFLFFFVFFFCCCFFFFFCCVLFWICFLCNIHEYSNCPNSFPVKTASHHWLPLGLVHLLALMLLDIIIYICTAEIRNVNILFVKWIISCPELAGFCL